MIYDQIRYIEANSHRFTMTDWFQALTDISINLTLCHKTGKAKTSINPFSNHRNQQIIEEIKLEPIETQLVFFKKEKLPHPKNIEIVEFNSKFRPVVAQNKLYAIFPVMLSEILSWDEEYLKGIDNFKPKKKIQRYSKHKSHKRLLNQNTPIFESIIV